MVIKFKDIVNRADWFNELRKEYLKSNKTICPLCSHKLIKKHEGLVCTNSLCLLHFKLEKGWVYLDGKKKRSLEFFKDKYDFDINKFKNLKKWLRKKDEIFHKRGRKCEICESEISLHLHHIILRSESPSLTFDDENLMILCESCHIQIHSEDKYRFDLNGN